ncbi:MAG: hypothetical protein M5R36_29615 [Deltaproteobacteria bacterium]|nr:hypothetical protein [Deltaproteobacteria bacterium]
MRCFPWLLAAAVLMSLALAAACSGGDDDDDHSNETDFPDDDDVDDDVIDDDTDDDVDDDTEDGTDDDTGDDDTGDDDTEPLPDDYVAPWPQTNIESHPYDETPAAGPLRGKAREYDQWHRDNAQPDYGGNVHAYFTDATYQTILNYHGFGDSCEWTGTYAGAQAMRYHATGDPVAKDNVIRMIDALIGYLYVTDTPGFIARYWAPQTSLIYGGDAWCDARDRCHHVESGEYNGDFWYGETSRDMYTGWFFGMAMAYDLVDDDAMRAKIRTAVSDVLDALIDHQWWIIDEGGEPTDAAPQVLAPFQLAWTLIGYHITGNEDYADAMRRWLRDESHWMMRLQCISIMNRYAQYFGNNLSHVNWFNILRLGKVYFSPEDNAFFQEVFDTQVHGFTRLSHNPWFTGIYMSTDLYTPAKDDAFLDQLTEDLTDFRDPPLYEYHLDARTGWTPDPLSVFLHDLQTQYPWLIDIMGTWDVQARDPFPVDEQCPAGFMFQWNPFQVEACGTEDLTKVHSGHDYLAAYWMASYLGYVTKDM